MLGHILLVQFVEERHSMLDLVGVGEAYFLKAGVNLRSLHIVWKLSDESCRNQSDAVLVVVEQFEVVLLDVDCVNRASLETFAAVDTFVVVYHSLAFSYPYCFGRTRPQAVRTSGTHIAVNTKRVVEV